eukprot:RCo026746
MKNKETFSVTVRVRPPAVGCREIKAVRSLENPVSKWSWDDCRIRCIDPDEKNCEYIFQHIFGPKAGTFELHSVVTQPLVERAFLGFNGVCVCYGQTFSGKTFTILGDGSSPGLIPLSVQEMLRLFSQNPRGQSILRVSYLEIYNETLKDLLTDTHATLSIQDHPQRGSVVIGLTEVIVTTLGQVMGLLEEGEARRMMGKNNVHLHASRSHTIFQMAVESRGLCESDVRVSTLHLVDLAGSESSSTFAQPTPEDILQHLKGSATAGGRASGKHAQALREREGKSIRQSLLALVRVVNMLAKNEAYIPYRDSKLTRILSTALGGNAHTAVICTVNPAELRETTYTLRFATTAKSIRNHPRVVQGGTEGILNQAALRSEAAHKDHGPALTELKPADVQEVACLGLSKQRLATWLQAERAEDAEERELRRALEARVVDCHSLHTLRHFLLPSDPPRESPPRPTSPCTSSPPLSPLSPLSPLQSPLPEGDRYCSPDGALPRPALGDPEGGPVGCSGAALSPQPERHSVDALTDRDTADHLHAQLVTAGQAQPSEDSRAALSALRHGVETMQGQLSELQTREQGHQQDVSKLKGALAAAERKRAGELRLRVEFCEALLPLLPALHLPAPEQSALLRAVALGPPEECDAALAAIAERARQQQQQSRSRSSSACAATKGSSSCGGGSAVGLAKRRVPLSDLNSSGPATSRVGPCASSRGPPAGPSSRPSPQTSSTAHQPSQLAVSSVPAADPRKGRTVL